MKILVVLVLAVTFWGCSDDRSKIENQSLKPENALNLSEEKRRVRGAIYGSSDSCSESSFHANIRKRTDCNRFSDSAPSWSIKVDGNCINISDTNLRHACRQVQGRLSENNGHAIYAGNDSCSIGSFVSSVNSRTDCSEFSSSEASWSIRVNGSCINISDTNQQHACRQIQGRLAASSDNAVYAGNDSCSVNSFVSLVDESTNCSDFSSSEASWSIRVNGSCLNISDTNQQHACRQIQGRLAQSSGNAVYSGNDSCSVNSFVASVNEQTNCSEFSSSEASWSIRVNGSCINISDTNQQHACRQVLGRLSQSSGNAVYSGNDSCSVNSFVSSVDEFTDCSQFSSSQASWSIRVNGSCINISDTNQQHACRQIQGRLSQSSGNAVYSGNDSCSINSFVSSVDEFTDCSQFSSSQASWSIRVNGSCVNISDTNQQHACRQIQGRLSQSSGNAVYSGNDSCSVNSFVSSVNEETDCNSFSDSNASWSIRFNGSCINISDTNQRHACRQIQGRLAQNSGNAVYAGNDSCSVNSFVGTVGKRTNCNRFSDSEAAWSIRVNGSCINISDTNQRHACRQIQGRLVQDSGHAVYGGNDSCSVGSFLGVVTRRTRCERKFKSSEASWSIRVRGSCINISDTNAVHACRQIQGRL